MIPEILQSRVALIAIRHYAALSYLYYEEDFSAVEDFEFDELCVWLRENYKWVKPHDVNNYLDKSALKAGTGFNIAKKVSGQTKEFATFLKAGDLPKGLSSLNGIKPHVVEQLRKDFKVAKKKKPKYDYSDLA